MPADRRQENPLNSKLRAIVDSCKAPSGFHGRAAFLNIAQPRTIFAHAVVRNYAAIAGRCRGIPSSRTALAGTLSLAVGLGGRLRGGPTLCTAFEHRAASCPGAVQIGRAS